MSKGITFDTKNGSGLKIGIVVASWNSEITFALRDGCVQALTDAGVERGDIVIREVPGSYEVVYGAKLLIEQGADAVVTIGCLIKGETMHFEYICEAVTQGIMRLNVEKSAPVIFGVLACLSEEQAIARSTGENNHGYGWGQSAVEMALLKNGS